MKVKKQLEQLLKKEIVILDGAMGTELQKRGLPEGVCPEQWCLENPSHLLNVHQDYISAGSEIIYTCTFGANRFKLGQYGITDAKGVNAGLTRYACRAAGKKVLVAGDIGPSGCFVAPFGMLSFEEAVEAFKEQVRGLLAGGVDLLVIETMIDIQEARAALIAVKELTPKFVMVTMTYERDGRTLNGTDPVAALVTLQSLGADAVGCNCSCGPQEMGSLIAEMKPYATVPLIAKPNAGLPRLAGNNTVFDMDFQTFASQTKICAVRGANIIGGCCGTTPGHIRELKKVLEKENPQPVRQKSISALSSARQAVLLEKKQTVYIVGERINPTGKKALQQELKSGTFSLVRQMVKEQTAQKADLLDVNMGLPGGDEQELMNRAISLLSTITPLPLVIDSSDPAVIESALRFYPGRALINSVSAEKSKMKRLLTAAAKYGAMCILLPISEKELPLTFEKRRPVIEFLLTQARRHGLTDDDLVIDGLTMAVSSSPDAALQTLSTIEWCAENLSLHTIVGLSNVSFGLPRRRSVNAAFLALARERGLTMAIMNPGEKDTALVEKATEVLCGRDKDAREYIAYCGHIRPEAKQRQADQLPTVFDCIVEGNRDDIVAAIERQQVQGKDSRALLDQEMVPAITHVGKLYDSKQYFLPQLIASAETMKKGFEHIKPHLEKDPAGIKNEKVVILATVRGDIHDIGKNIVALLLQNHGYKVIDLGNNVPAQKIIAGIKEHRPAAVGLSALMTTTMVNMKETIDLAVQEKVNCRFIVGGAVVTESFAHSLGAEYARDGVEAVRILGRLTGQNDQLPGTK